jgi:RNA polymerase sigma factor (sigma-70 family)
MARSQTEQLPVVDEWGEVLFFTDDVGARELFDARKARLVNAGRMRLLLVTVRTVQPEETGDWASGVHLPNPFDLVAGRERHEVLERCQETLSDGNRKLLRLRYWNDLTFAEVAAAMDVTPAAVSTMHHRVLEKMEHQLRELKIVRIEQI